MPRPTSHRIRAAAVVNALSLILSAVAWSFPSTLSAIEPPAIQTYASFSRKISPAASDDVYSQMPWAQFLLGHDSSFGRYLVVPEKV